MNTNLARYRKVARQVNSITKPLIPIKRHVCVNVKLNCAKVRCTHSPTWMCTGRGWNIELAQYYLLSAHCAQSVGKHFWLSRYQKHFLRNRWKNSSAFAYTFGTKNKVESIIFLEGLNRTVPYNTWSLSFWILVLLRLSQGKNLLRYGCDYSSIGTSTYKEVREGFCFSWKQVSWIDSLINFVPISSLTKLIVTQTSKCFKKLWYGVSSLILMFWSILLISLGLILRTVEL